MPGDIVEDPHAILLFRTKLKYGKVAAMNTKELEVLEQAEKEAAEKEAAEKEAAEKEAAEKEAAEKEAAEKEATEKAATKELPSPPQSSATSDAPITVGAPKVVVESGDN